MSRVVPLTVTAMVVAAMCMMPTSVARAASEEEIERAIEVGVENVYRNQQADGRWGQFDWAGGHHYPWGRDAIALLTLEFAHVPVEDARYQKGLKNFLEADLEQNYEICCRTMTLARLTRRTEGKQKEGYRTALKRDVKWIEEAQGEHGGWTYTSLHGGKGVHDFSNSQMAVLALSEAIMAGVEVSPVVMKKAQEIFLKAQRADGGWNYALNDDRQESYGSMTAAAVATLFITRDYLNPQVGCPCGNSGRRRDPTDGAIDAGVKWLAEKFVHDKNPEYRQAAWIEYWLYSAERVGMASGLKYFGDHNWYKEGADRCVRVTGLGGQNFPFACLATIFLIKGKAPILMNKLQWDGEWNLHPRDAANVVQYVSLQKEQPLQWQVVPLQAPMEEWHEAPIMYISADEKIELTDEHKAKLKEFVSTGGTLLFEASCASRAAKTWWVALCKELWPEYEFQLIGKEHPLWSADLKIVGRLPVLQGLSDGMRVFAFYAPADISCTWSTNASNRFQSYFDMGGNLYMYATDKITIRSRFAEKPAPPDYYAAASISSPKPKLKVMRAKHTGDWYVGSHYKPLEWYNSTRDRAAPELAPAEAASASDASLAEQDIAWMVGRQDVGLSEADAKAMKEWLAGSGGFLFAEAAMGDERFRKSFETLAQTMGLKLRPLTDADGLLTGKMDGASGYNVTKVRFTYHLRGQRVGQPAPALMGIYLPVGGEDKLVGVFSPFDVTFSLTENRAFGNLGYETDDARAIATNIFLLAASRKKAP